MTRKSKIVASNAAWAILIRLRRVQMAKKKILCWMEQWASILSNGSKYEKGLGRFIYEWLEYSGACSQITLVGLTKIYGEQGLLRKAKKYALKSYALDPDCADTLNHLGLLCIYERDLSKAEYFLVKALANKQKCASIMSNMALMRLKQERYTESIMYATKALRIEQNNLRTRMIRAEAWLLAENGPKSVKDLIKCVAMMPDNAECHLKLGEAYRMSGDYNQSEQAYNNAIILEGRNVDNIIGLAISKLYRGENDAAESLFNEALQYARTKSTLSEIYNAQGLIEVNRGDFSSALRLFNRARKENQKNTGAIHNIGFANGLAGNVKDAINAYKKVIERNTELTEVAKLQLAMCLMSIGDYKNGLELYESRFKALEIDIDKEISLLKWNPREEEKPDHLLVVSEQGYGDTIQFVRYIRLLEENGIHVTLSAPNALHGILGSSLRHTKLISKSEHKAIDRGFWIPLMSLPYLLGIERGFNLANNEYIKVDQQKISAWEELLHQERRPLIAVHWQGNPNTEKTNLKGRSFNINEYFKIIETTKGTIISLQKGEASNQLEECGFKNKITRHQCLINSSYDFEDTAAIIKCCDLVLTNDSSPVHLAGAMGVETWLFLQKVPDWRWGLEGERTAWYSSVKIFRQEQNGCWKHVMKKASENWNWVG